MPSSGLIRKNLLVALEGTLIPAASAMTPLRLLLAEPPFDPPSDINVEPLPCPPLNIAAAIQTYPDGQVWEQEALHTTRYPYLMCVFEGEADLRVGITTEVKRSDLTFDPEIGGYVITLPALSFVLIPPPVAHPLGDRPFWERRGLAAASRIFWIYGLPGGALCHISITQGGSHQGEYSLFVEDRHCAIAFDLLLAELRRPRPNTEIARTQLLFVLLSMRRELSEGSPQMTDGLYSRFPEDIPHSGTLLSPGAQAVAKACDYIRLNLHQKLSPPLIAVQVRLKQGRLNRLFQNELGLSIMQYVVNQRIEAAQLLLERSELSMQEIGRLVGFTHLSHFSHTFRTHTGLSPLRFRQTRAK